MAIATQRFNFDTYAAPVRLTVAEVQTFLTTLGDPAQAAKVARMQQLQAALEARMRQINARSPAIDGKSTNPFVLAAYAELFDIASLKQVDDIVAAAKVFSSLETAAGRVVEDVVPPFYGWAQVDSPGHTLLSEIDSARVKDGTVELIALKSGPMCINDSMVSQIANAVSNNWIAWAENYGVNDVRYIVGMNYSTARNSNKKDWHIVRLAQERLAAQGLQITQGCSRPAPRRPIADAFFTAVSGDKTLRVETMQGRGLWAHVAGASDAFLQICWAMTKCLNPAAVAAGGNYTTGEMREIVAFSARVNAPNVSEAEKQWLVLFARHFVDVLEGEQPQPIVLI
ncbi:MAG: hypothetical protein HC844_03640 [Tabrizicola sp.]|nr:hypothetical protein [Tabrizicola sp.]